MDILWTAEGDNSSIVAGEEQSPLNVSYSNVSCLEAITKEKMKWKKL